MPINYASPHKRRRPKFYPYASIRTCMCCDRPADWVSYDHNPLANEHLCDPCYGALEEEAQ